MRFVTIMKSVEAAGPPAKALADAVARLGAEGPRLGVLVETGEGETESRQIDASASTPGGAGQ
jgi:hypothetical protein